jgi:hypothetical protein
LLSKIIKIEIYRSVILPVVLYECETWSLTLREGHRLRVFESRMLRKIFGPTKEVVTGDWRKLYNVYSSRNIIWVTKLRRMEWVGNVTRMGQKRNIYRVSVEKPEAKRPLRRPSHTWEDNIELDLNEMEWDGLDWIPLSQARGQQWAFVKMVMNLQFP